MRTIKFRGKNIETGEWVYGFYTQGGYIREDGTMKVRHIIHSDFLYDVEKDTIGQYTGLQDKNGVEIYEGDILAKENERDKYVIIWNEYYSQFQGMWRKNPLTAVNIYSMISLGYKVIGNIHDNPELLKGE